MSRIYTLHGPRPYFDPKQEEEANKETPAQKVEREFQENAAKLAKDQGLIEDKKEEKEEKEEKDENKDEEADDTEEEKEEELKAEDLAKAKALYKVLNNPNTAMAGLELLVKQAGFKLSQVAVDKEEKKEVIKSIKETIKEKLGSKIPYLSEDLGAVLEEVITSAVKEHTKDLKQQVESESQIRREAEMRTTFEKVVEEYEGVNDSILQEVVKIQERQEIIPGKMTPDKYFKTCLMLAADNLGVSISKKTAESKKENGNSRQREEKKGGDALARLGGKQNATHKEGLNKVKITTLNQAIEEAAKVVDSKFA